MFARPRPFRARFAASRPLAWFATLPFALTLAMPPAPAEPPATGLGAPDIIIGRDELQTYDTSFYGVLDVLALRAGLTYMATGDQASEDWLLVRGWPRDSSRNVLILLDGMPINNASTESVELHDIPLDIVERVEIYKPPLPALYGGYHAVINFVPAEPAANGGLRVSAAMGSFNTYIAEVGGAANWQSIRGAVDMEMLNSANLTGVPRTPPVDDVIYEDRSYRDYAPTLRLAWQPSKNTRVRLISLYSHGRKMFSDDEYRNRWFSATAASASQQIGKAGEIIARGHYAREHFFLRLYMHPDVSREDRQRTGGRLESRWHLPFGQTLSAGAETAHTRVEAPSWDAALTRGGVWLEDTLSPLDWLSLAAGVRYDFAPDLDGGHVSPTAALEFRPWAGGALYGRWSRQVRWPSLGEVPGTASIGPEIMTGYTAGVRQEVLEGRITAKTAWFDLWLEGELDIDPQVFEYRNVTRETHSQGVEIDVFAAITQALGAGAAYTYSRFVHDDSSAPIAYGPPENQAAARLFYNNGRDTGRLTARYTGEKVGVYRMMGRPTKVEDALILDLYYGRRFGDGLLVFMNFGNLLDVCYETFQGRPMFPRTILAGIEISSF